MKQYVKPQFEVVEIEEESHGNTGLPFGLCKKYGIALPDKATPRDAWNALKGVGVMPPWTPDGKKQYTDDGKHVDGENIPTESEEDRKIRIDKAKKEVYDGIEDKLSEFPATYRKALYSHLENLTDDEVEVFAKTLNKGYFIKGDGKFSPTFKTVYVPTGKGSDLDVALGYNYKATTFSHEYGHFLANLISRSNAEKRTIGGGLWDTKDFNEDKEIQAVLDEDAKNLFSQIMKEKGLPELENLNNDSLAFYNRSNYDTFNKQKQAVFDWLKGLTDRNNEKWTFEYKYKPDKSLYFQKAPKMEKHYEAHSWQSEAWQARVVELNKAIDERNAEKKRAYQEYKNSDRYKQDLARYEQRLAKYEEYQKEVGIDLQRNGFLGDFIAGATRGRINPINNGEWGHKDSYWQNHSNGVETWAEYVSFKLTKDSKGLSNFSKYLPKTYAKYEEIYSKLKEML